MPLYDYWCAKCDLDYKDIVKPLSHYNEAFNCSNCGDVCVKKWSRVSMQPDNMHQGFFYPALNQNFTSKSQWEKTMKEKGLAVYEKGMEKGIPTNNKERIEKRNKERDIEVIKKEVAEIIKDY